MRDPLDFESDVGSNFTKIAHKMKIGIIIIIFIGLFFGLQKQLNYFYYKTSAKQKMIVENNNFIVQYVGFKTKLSETDFVKRWTPFASNFKSAGIKSIDLYQVQDDENLTFISRNIWESKTYFDNFPTGVAGSGSGGGISVTQFGGYWIEEADLPKPNSMQILFSNDYTTPTSQHITRNQCAKNVKFLKVIEYLNVERPIVPKQTLFCKHLKTM